VTSAETYVKTNPRPTSAAGGGTAEAEEQAAVARKKINAIRAEINQLGLPIGWVLKPANGQDLEAYKVDSRRVPDSGYGWFLKILGIFLTALAVSQGAPFWFDLLNKIIVIRSTIKPHEKSQEQPSKDKPAPETIKKKDGGQEGDATS